MLQDFVICYWSFYECRENIGISHAGLSHIDISRRREVWSWSEADWGSNDSPAIVILACSKTQLFLGVAGYCLVRNVAILMWEALYELGQYS
jgi:Zn-finger protein